CQGVQSSAMTAMSRLRAGVRLLLKAAAKRLEALGADAGQRLDRPWDHAADDAGTSTADTLVGTCEAPTDAASTAPSGPELVPFGAIDELIARAQAVEREQSFGERVAFLDRFRLDTGTVSLPDDPASTAYAAAQMALYERIAGTAGYDADVDEVMTID